jgi:AraC family transcriptional regulator
MQCNNEPARVRAARHSDLNGDGQNSPCPLQVGAFFGRNRVSYSQSGFVLSDTEYQPALKVPVHFHELAYFCLLLNGGYWEAYGRRRVVYDPFSLVFHPPKEVHHGDISSAGSRCFHVEIAPYWLERLREHGKVPTDALDLHSGELVWLAKRLYREFRAGTAASPLVIEGIVLEMLGLLVRAPKTGEQNAPKWLATVAARLHEEFSQPLTVGEMAADLGVSPVRLSRLFRQFYGEPIGDYLRRIRVQFACRALANPATELTQVAIDAGFADQSHFTRVFKRVTGLTPGDFRRVAQEPTAQPRLNKRR